LDGLGKIPAYVERAKRLNIAALAITDHGTMGGVFEHYRTCRDADIEPIIGLEAYFVPSVSEARQFKNAERFHVTLLAKGEQGYRVLNELNTAAHSNFYYKPLVDRALLGQLGEDAQHLVCLSGCTGSKISQLWIAQDPTYVDEIQWWQSIFHRNFYLEAQYHSIDTDQLVLGGILETQSHTRLKHVFTNDCHYVSKRDGAPHDALLAIQTAANIDDPDRFRFDGSGYHLRSRRELYRVVVEAGYDPRWVKNGIENSLSIARSCHTRIAEWETRTWHIPQYPGAKDPERLLVKLVRTALDERGLSQDLRYVRRAKHEIRQIKKVGIADFLLICREQNRWCATRPKPIRVGPGRGSVAGSLIGWLIGMHKIDPIRHNTRFERFINPERPKMPDVDTDFQPSRRDEVIEHLKHLYGADNVIQVAAYQTMGVKGTFRKLARAHGMDWNEINRISTKLNPGGTDEDTDDISVLPAEVRENYPDIHAQIQALIGTKSALSSHAAGLLIFAPDDPVKDLVPQMWLTGQKRLVAAFDLKSTEKMGLMKMDELVLRTLDTIQVCVDMLSENGIEIEPDDWIPDEEDRDSDVYAMLGSGRTAGVFQMEGNTNTRGIQEVGCRYFEDIVATTSLYRAGPLGAGAATRYLANKRSKKIRVAHESLRPILANSWGEMIYQEQMMDICHDIAGFNWTDTDDVKEIVRFKDPARMHAYRQKFVDGCKNHSELDENTALEIWAMIESQSSYLFNRSHAIAYSYLSYQTARLKYLYPVEYMAAYMATVDADTDAHKANRNKVLSEAHEMGVHILAPDINQSGIHMTCCADDQRIGLVRGPWMRFGFVDLKGIGESKAAKLVTARDQDPVGFYGVQDVAEAIDKRTLGILGDSGALASVGGPKVTTRQIEQYIDWDFSDRMAKYRPQLRSQVKFPTKEGQWGQVAGELIASESRMTKKNTHFRVWTLKWSPSETFRITLWDSTSGIWDTPIGSILAVEGKYSREFDNIGVSDPDYVTVIARRKR